jgi:hypothetical protein
MKEPNITDGFVLRELEVADHRLELSRIDAELTEILFVSEGESDRFANFFAPVGDVENGGLDGFLAFSPGFPQEVAEVGFSVDGSGLFIDVHGVLS